MAIVLKVKWVEQSNQPEPHLRIRQIGGDSGQMQWRHTQAKAIEGIENGLFAYHLERNARAVKVDITQDADGRKYLTVQAAPSHALLELPGFPDSAPPEAAIL